jgi:hypothetical protein
LPRGGPPVAAPSLREKRRRILWSRQLSTEQTREI